MLIKPNVIKHKANVGVNTLIVSPLNVNPNASNLPSAKILIYPHVVIHENQSRGSQEKQSSNISSQITCAGGQEKLSFSQSSTKINLLLEDMKIIWSHLLPTWRKKVIKAAFCASWELFSAVYSLPTGITIGNSEVYTVISYQFGLFVCLCHVQKYGT